MSPDQYLVAVIRCGNAVLWLVLAADIFKHSRIMLNTLARRLITVTMAFGMMMFAAGSFAPTYIPGDVMRLVYTLFPGFSALVAFAILKTWRS